MDKIIAKIAALGVPGLVLLFLISSKGLAGAAAITSTLAMLGGPYGMIGGIAALGAMVLISDALTKYGLQKLFAGVVGLLLANGMTRVQIRTEIKSIPLSKDLKRKLLKLL